MKTCKKCGHEMADNSSVCPECGWRPTSRITKVFAGLLIAGVAFGVYDTMSHPDGAPKQDAAWQKHGGIAVAAAKVWRSGLKDPDSAKIHSAVLEDTGAWCLDLGAKNGFGAYVRNYIVISPKGEPQFSDSEPNDNFRTTWNSYCNATGAEYADVVRASL